ncbi:MAG TPA: serine/threonine-protein kinase [Candidatus Limnocylindrales bacterium]
MMLIANRYRLLWPLGQGGMGRVWKARDETLNRDVAVKELVLPSGLDADERAELRERVRREARAIAKLNHPGVVRIHDVLSVGHGDDGGGDPWIIMQYLPGGSLQDMLTKRDTLPPQRAARIGLDLLAALRATHKVGVVHRDIKPGNVLFGEDGQAVLTDFGIATVPGDPFKTRTGILLGSPAYLAPERARGGKAGPEADMWSLGATLFAAVEGQPPFGRASTMETLLSLVNDPVPEPARAGALAPALKGLLDKNPATRMRPADAEGLLRRAAGQTVPLPPTKPAAVAPTAPLRSPQPPVSSPPRPPVSPPPRSPVSSPPRPARRRGRKGFLLVALLAAAAVAALLAFDSQTTPDAGRTDPPNPPASAAAPSPSPSPFSSPSASKAGTLPAGWQLRDDGSGFRVPVPDGWRFGRDEDGRAQWLEPGGRVQLLIEGSRQPKPDPVKDWLTQEADRRGGYRNYERVRIEAVSYWDSAADWEFTYNSRNGNTRLHVLNRGFVTAPDQAYSIYWATPDSQWESWRDELQIVLDGFVPARS